MHFMAGRCFKCTSNNCAVMGYHATIPQVASSNSSENEINSESSDIMITPPQPGKYFLVTGKDFPFCRKYIRLISLINYGWLVAERDQLKLRRTQINTWMPF